MNFDIVMISIEVIYCQGIYGFDSLQMKSQLKYILLYFEIFSSKTLNFFIFKKM